LVEIATRLAGIPVDRKQVATLIAGKRIAGVAYIDNQILLNAASRTAHQTSAGYAPFVGKNKLFLEKIVVKHIGILTGTPNSRVIKGTQSVPPKGDFPFDNRWLQRRHRTGTGRFEQR
jgi:hypothetical protein